MGELISEHRGDAKSGVLRLHCTLQRVSPVSMSTEDSMIDPMNVREMEKKKHAETIFQDHKHHSKHHKHQGEQLDASAKKTRAQGFGSVAHSGVGHTKHGSVQDNIDNDLYE